MSDLPTDIDNLADRLADTLQSVYVSSVQQRGEADSATEEADLATGRVIQETLNERSTDFPGRGLRVPAPRTGLLLNERSTYFPGRGLRVLVPRTGELDGRYGTDVELSDRDEDHTIDSRMEAFREAGGRVLRLQFTVNHLEPAVPLHGNLQEAEDAVGGESVVEAEDDDGGLIWEYPGQVSDASVYDWRQNAFVGCNSCLDQKPVEEVWEAPCAHIYCDVCLEILVQNWYTSTRAPACCGTVLPWEDYKSTINPELAAALDAKKEELDSKDRTYCSEQTCSTFIGAQDISADTATATCSVCKKVTCTKCKAASHTGDCVPDATISNELEQAEQEGWKRCRQCRMVVEREDGCPHMTCLCGYEFCYDCGGPYRSCECQEIEQQDFDHDFEAAQEEDFEETIRAPPPPWDRDYTIWLPVEADTEAANALPAEEEEQVDSAGTVTEDGEVFGPLSEVKWKRIDRFREIENHHTLGHGGSGNKWVRSSGSNQCEYCRDILWWYVLRCPDCDMRLCRQCSRLHG